MIPCAGGRIKIYHVAAAWVGLRCWPLPHKTTKTKNAKIAALKQHHLITPHLVGAAGLRGAGPDVLLVQVGALRREAVDAKEPALAGGESPPHLTTKENVIYTHTYVHTQNTHAYTHKTHTKYKHEYTKHTHTVYTQTSTSKCLVQQKKTRLLCIGKRRRGFVQ